MVVPNSNKKEEVLQLMKEKDKIEAKIMEMGNVLTANHVRMNDPLVDDSGFPRNDIDVYQVRHARHQIICLQNDLKSIMKEIEKGLEMIHAEGGGNNEYKQTRKLAENIFEDNGSGSSINTTNFNTFLTVTVVSEKSPADLAGLRVDDEILEFGSINSTNFREVSQIGEIVQRRENQNIRISIKRNTVTLCLNLIPKKWNGRGLLGCNITGNLESIER